MLIHPKILLSLLLTYVFMQFYMSRGRDADAVRVVHAIAAYNGKTSSLTLEDLTRHGISKNLDAINIGTAESGLDTSRKAAFLRQVKKFDAEHIKALFRTRQLAWSTSCIIIIWGDSFAVEPTSLRES